MHEDATPSPDTTFEVAKQLMNVSNKYIIFILSARLLSITHMNNAFEVALIGELNNMDTLHCDLEHVRYNNDEKLWAHNDGDD